jgi:hypothetical protein
MTYLEKLKDPRWQKKRLEILQRDNWTCQCCGDTENTLHVHHWFYKKGKDPWEYDAEDLSTLCEDCHEAERLCRDDFEESLIECLRAYHFFFDDLVNLINLINTGTITRAELVERRIKYREKIDSRRDGADE